MPRIRSTKSTAAHIIGVGSSRVARATDDFLTACLNWWGTGADGSLTVGSNGQNTTLSSSTDGDVIVKNYSYLRILSGYTLTVSNRCRGLALYVDGDCLIEGALSMSARGAYTPNIMSEVDSNGLRFVRRKSGQTQTLANSVVSGTGSALIAAEACQPGISGNGKIYQIPRLCAAGAPAIQGSDTAGNTGGTLTMGTGGGGCGAIDNGYGGYSGAGAQGSCFSGGAGGGGNKWGSSNVSSEGGFAYGGAGGRGLYGSGGAGNPGGVGGLESLGNDPAQSGYSGTGGLLLLFVRGTLTIASTGRIYAKGANGGPAASTPGYLCGGGGSGGGLVVALYGTSYSNSGSIDVSGGAGGTAYSSSFCGGAGGAGYVLVEKVDI